MTKANIAKLERLIARIHRTSNEVENLRNKHGEVGWLEMTFCMGALDKAAGELDTLVSNAHFLEGETK